MVCLPAGVTPLVPPDLPKGVEVSVRQAADRVLYFIQNTTEVTQVMSSVVAGTDLLTGQAVGGSLTLPPCGCAIIKLG